MENTTALQGEDLRLHLTEVLDIDFDKNIIFITDYDQYDMFNSINAEHQYRGGYHAFTEWISWNMFSGEGEWFLYIVILGHIEKFQYDVDGKLERSVNITDNTYYEKEEI